MKLQLECPRCYSRNCFEAKKQKGFCRECHRVDTLDKFETTFQNGESWNEKEFDEEYKLKILQP